MRKLLIKVALLSAVTAVLMTATAAAASIGTAVVKADALRLRSQPNTNCSTLAYLGNGAKVQVDEQLPGWYKVSYQESAGYVSADYVTFTAKAETEAAAAGGGAQISGSEVNFRAAPDTESEILAVLYTGDQVTLLETAGEWCKVSFKEQTGYVYAEYVSVNGVAQANARGIITGSCVNVRSGPGTDHDIVGKVYAGNVIQLESLADGWYAMSYDGTEGYVCADYVRQYTNSSTSSIGEEAAALALSYVGVPYVYGGASAKGFDCSGFTMYVFAQFGYTLSHSASAQWKDSGVSVERADLQPGDLVLFNDPSRNAGKACSHVGIYIGEDQFVHASSSTSSGRMVRISSLTEGYYNTYYKGAKRIG